MRIVRAGLTLLIMASLFLVSCNTTSTTTAANNKIIFSNYVSENNSYLIYSADQDGSNQVELGQWYPGSTKDPGQLWSEKGGRLAYLDVNYPQVTLYTIDADGSNKHLVADLTGTSISNVCMFPNGNTVLYIENTNTKISAIDTAAGTAKTLLNFNGSQILSLSVSQDNTKIAFVGKTVTPFTRFNVYIMNADGSNLKELTDYQSVELQNSPPLIWSADGKKLLAVATTSRNDLDAFTDLELIDASNGNITNLTSTANTSETSPAWSPDGRKIAFTATGFTGQISSNIFVMDANGKNVTKIFDNGASPCWLPDSKRIIAADTGTDETFSGKLFVINDDGTGYQGIGSLTGEFPLWLAY